MLSKSKFKSLLTLAAVAAFACTTAQLQAVTVLNLGAPTPTTVGGYSPTTTADYGDFPYTPDCGTVGAIVNGNATLTTHINNGEDGALFWDPPTGNIAAPILTLTFDLNIGTAGTATGRDVKASLTQQDSVLSTTSQLVHTVFGLNVLDGSTRLLRFAAAATDDNGGVFGIRVPTGTSKIERFYYPGTDDLWLDDDGQPYTMQVWEYQIIPFFTYANGEDYTISLTANFITGQLDILVNDIPQTLATPYDLPLALNARISETFFFMNGSYGCENSLTFGNVILTANVPEPSSLSILALAAGASLLVRRRKH